MENRDFRDRLKSHTREANPMAWEQMEQLLDSVDSKKEDDKKRGFWWFFWGVFVAILAGITWFSLGIQNDKEERYWSNEIQLEKSSEQEIGMKSSNDLKDETKNGKVKNLNVNSEERIETLEKIENEAAATNNVNRTAVVTQGKEGSASKNSGFSVAQRNEGNVVSGSEANESINSNPKAIVDSGSAPHGSLVQSEQGNNIPTEAKVSTGIDSQSNKIKNVIENSEKKNSSETDELKNIESRILNTENSVETTIKASMGDAIQKSEIDRKSVSEISGKSENEREILRQLSRIQLTLLGVDFERENAFVMPKVEIFKQLGISTFIGGGYAYFNENPGYFLSGGIIYDVDRILDIEVNTSFSYGSEQSIPEGELFTFEHELDFSLLVHLNLIKSDRHKLALLGGAGYGFYSGERIIRGSQVTVDKRSSSGRSLQGGIDYKWRFDKSRSVGLRAGFVSYDDIIFYISPRFLFEF